MTEVIIVILLVLCVIQFAFILSAHNNIKRYRAIIDSQNADMDDKEAQDFFKLCRVVLSCESIEQLDVAKRYYAQYAMRYEPSDFVEYHIMRLENEISTDK